MRPQSPVRVLPAFHLRAKIWNKVSRSSCSMLYPPRNLQLKFHIVGERHSLKLSSPCLLMNHQTILVCTINSDWAGENPDLETEGIEPRTVCMPSHRALAIHQLLHGSLSSLPSYHLYAQLLCQNQLLLTPCDGTPHCSEEPGMCEQ